MELYSGEIHKLISLVSLFVSVQSYSEVYCKLYRKHSIIVIRNQKQNTQTEQIQFMVNRIPNYNRRPRIDRGKQNTGKLRRKAGSLTNLMSYKDNQTLIKQ